MSDKITESPQIRFAGFTDAWEQRKLGEMLEKVSAPVELEKELMYKQIGIRSHGKGIFYKESVTGKSIGNKRVFWVEPDSLILNIVFAWEQAVARTTEKEVGMIASHRFPMYRMKRELLDLDFIVHFFLTLKGKQLLESASPGGAGRNKTLGQKEFESLRLKLPSCDEQHKIGEFIDTLDDTITLHQRKLVMLKDTKKGLLQKMFPKDGADVPEIRFPGFNDAWEQRELKEMFVKGGSGGTPRSTNKDYYKGEIPFLGISDISNSNGYIDYTQKHISEEGLNNSSAWIVPKGAITLAMYASVGKIAILNVDVATSQAFYNMVFNDIIIRDFIYHRLVKANINEEWRELISTGTQPNLNAEKVKNFQILLPKDKSEQSKVGQFFNQLDNLITLHQRELNSLKNLKESLLQQMFI